MKGPFIYETTTTTGTGTITLGGAVTAAYIEFSDHFANGDEVDYVIRDGNNFEIGRGVYSSGTLTRADVQATLVSGTYTKLNATAISLSGSAYVTCDHTHRTIDMKFPGVWASYPYLISKHIGVTSNTTLLLTQNREYYVPFYWEGGSHQSISIVVKTSTSPASIRLALYKCASDGLPSSLVVDAGAVSGTTTGLKTASYSSIYSDPGWYFTFIITNAASSSLGVHGVASSVTGGAFAQMPLGSYELVPVNYMYKAGTYGTAPSPASTGLSPSVSNTPLFQMGL